MITLTPSQNVAMGLLESRDNIFLTGAPGTGKSFLIQHYLSQQTEKIPVLASTGAAAILVGGRTFHSFFGLGIMQGGPEATYSKALKNKRLRARIRKANMIIIDEVSMLSSDAIDCAEKISRSFREADEPWGGLRVVAVGDFAQLPPVSRSRRKEWAFLGEAWASSQFKFVDLKEVKRTEDEEFLKLLEQVRWAKVTDELAEFLNQRTGEQFDREITRIFPKRMQTERFNFERLEEISGRKESYATTYRGEDRYIKILEKDAPIPPVISLKEGALVMLRMNDPKQRYVNGSLAKVFSMGKNIVTVELLSNGRLIEIEKICFSYIDADGNEVAVAENFPMSLAYASTIHKTQGATLDKIHVDLRRLWEPGQAYVALSRVRSAGGLSLEGWSESSIISDPMVQSFYSRSSGNYFKDLSGTGVEAYL